MHILVFVIDPGATAMRAIGRNVARERVEQGLSQEELGRRVGYTHSSISKIERGAMPGVPVERLAEIAAALGTNLATLASMDAVAS